MKCEHCNNDMHWEGPMQGGHMVCTHCACLTKDYGRSIMSDANRNFDAYLAEAKQGCGGCTGKVLADCDCVPEPDPEFNYADYEL